MDTDRLKGVCGFIYKEQKYKNTSKIISLFTDSLGKIPIYAQGAYRKNSSLQSITNNYSFVSLDISRGKSFYYINEGELIDSNSFLSKSIKNLVIMALVSELLDKTLYENQRDVNIFKLIESLIVNLKKRPEASLALVIGFLFKYSSFLGYRPRLAKCLCQNQANKNFYSIALGGLTCEVCRRGQSIALSEAEVENIQELLYQPLSKAILKEDVDGLALLEIGLLHIKYNFDLDKLNIEKWFSKVSF